MTDAKTILADMTLSEKRMRHTMGVVSAAKQLALAHFPSLDASRVEICALMHDFTKEYPIERQLSLCGEYGISLSDGEKREPKLLHSKTAAAIARDKYGLSEDECDAIFWHTTGRENMTPLETVIYLADYIEEFRDDKGCIKVREYYKKRMEKDPPEIALQKTLVFSFDTTIKHLMNLGRTISCETLVARNFYIEQLGRK